MFEDLRPHPIEVGGHGGAVAHEQEFDQAPRHGIAAVDRFALELDGGGIEELLDELFEGLFAGSARRVAGFPRLPSKWLELSGAFRLRHGKAG